MQPKRSADTGKGLSDLATHFVVHCPKCEGKALIDKVEKDWKLRCTACHHVETSGRWYGAMTAYASVKCRDCNASIRRSAPTDGIWKKLKLTCDQCGDECEYEAHMIKHQMDDGLMCDSVFGLPLWLQKEFRHDLFWAFNYEHLQLLEDFIGAKHRERGIEPRNTYRKNSSMASRLPEFIQKAGNRNELAKLIQELQAKV